MLYDSCCEQNPPPAIALSHFDKFILKPVRINESLANANQSAINEIQKNIDLHVKPMLASWNKQDGSRTLILQPVINDLKFVGGAKRALGGALAGSSAVLLGMQLRDQDSQKPVASPEFFQRAAAMGGAWSFGGTDNHMLARIVQVAKRYLEENYDKTVGGPTRGYSGEDQ